MAFDSSSPMVQSQTLREGLRAGGGEAIENPKGLGIAEKHNDGGGLDEAHVANIKLAGPAWLSHALLRAEQLQSNEAEAGDGSGKWCTCSGGRVCIHCSSGASTHASISSSSSLPCSTTHAQWLSMPLSNLQQQQTQPPSAEIVTDQLLAKNQFQRSVEQNPAATSEECKSMMGDVPTAYQPTTSSDIVDAEAADTDDHSSIWRNVRLKGEIVSHPLYDQLVTAHVACLRTATPVDQLPKIDAQLANASHMTAKYGVLVNDHESLNGEDKDELNGFMANYVLLLQSFKDQLQQHVRVHAMEAVVACWELEQSLLNLTGVTLCEGASATMSDDEDDYVENTDFYDPGFDGHDMTGFGSLIPSETERTLMERVRHELKLELKQGYRARINDVREEILRKRRAGKLPGDTTSVLKSWWHAHSKWPYPSEEEKTRLVQETGLELKQINNWFINQRKRNWHNNASASSLKNKRQR
ncbi:hypothetical protein O6H91_03G035000 [Diphasiastrum complanatum]|nr:hypothetical protein O6H91_Y131100 [Diphasiastrum complanatum]KAJ7296321.1 hypothetical protein O6H91_Y131100 [Diphasiastrum complanatum]KAJ7296323.1 hypothetical protein O6H91_Y131100 [Diphasiastrum complanatum]KAJ7561597.1 hypothetical protein O6H91_03G035000 [Diphasiastrum complanatum]KAJ7561599.1 hypothetical protein O6H91_03G035000 [Diphasiastrum complanatum]